MNRESSRLAVILLVGLSCATTGWALPTVCLTPEADDATPAFRAAIEKVRAAGGGSLAFAPGEYHFRAKSATPRHYYVSNHNQSDTVPVQLPLEGLRDVTLKGDRTRFVLHGATMGLAVVDSENVKVSGISVDWGRPFLTEAKVEGFEDGGTLVSVDAKTCPYDVRDGKFVVLGDGWESDSRWLLAFRGDTHALVERTVDIRWEGDVVRTAGAGRFLMKADLKRLGVRTGDLLALRPENRPPHPAVFVYRAKNTVLEDVVVHTSRGMGVICQRSEGFTWRGTRDAASRTSGVFAPKGSGRFLTLNADATHFSNVKGLVRIQNCLFEGMMDDAINVHATCLAIREKTARDAIRCRYMHADSYGFETFRPGETLRFIRGRTLENGPEVRVKDVTVHDPHEITLTLAEPVPDGIGVGDAVENADYHPAVDFLNNVVARNRARGALFTTPRPVKVVGNLFERVSGSAILFAGDAQGWYESGACEDVMVRNNVFRDCMTSQFQFCDGIISFYPMVDDLAAQKRRYHRNVFIENNLFETFGAPLLFAISTEDLTFRNNDVRYHDRIEGWGKPPFVFSHCANMRTAEGNRYFAAGDGASADKPRLAAIFSDHMVFAVGKPVRVFGTGEGDVRVTFRGQTAVASSSDGCWCATLPPGSAGGPFELKVAFGDGALTLRDVMVGEVLVMAGQSNMQFKLGESTSDRATWEGHPMIRAFTTTRLERQEPYAAKDGWVVLESANAGRWGAIGYETAIRRAKATGAAVGIVNAYQGASTVQAWMPRRLARSPRLSLPPGQCAHHDSRDEYYSLWNRSGTLYDNQFAEVLPFSVSAVVWYQGESNAGSVEEGTLYADALEAMIGQWRVDLGDSRLPFFVLQLASPLTGGPRKDAWRAIQDSQCRVAERCPFVTCIRTEDICETDKGIHPPTKWRIAERLCEKLAR